MRHAHKGPTFQEILARESRGNAVRLAQKARSASWLAKAYPREQRKLYAVKHRALAQLFRIPGAEPKILNAWMVGQSYLLSIRLPKHLGLLHVPFAVLDASTRVRHLAVVVTRVRDKRWCRRPLRPLRITRARQR